MKTLYFVLLFCILSIHINYAQVGIGTTNPEATLDIRSTNQATPTNIDGILIPKVNNFPTTNPTAVQDGMLVYVTGSGTPTKGFYYWNQTITNWVAVNNNNSGWSKTGDAGTNSTTNFIGTTDARDLSFRTNNVEKIRLTQKGQLEFLNTGNSVFIGEGAGANDDLTNNANTFIGLNSGQNNTFGAGNIALGNETLFNNTSGFNNVALGLLALRFNVNGRDNIAIGESSSRSNISGNDNTAIGTASLFLNLIGNSNVSIGNRNSFSINGSQNTSVGDSALEFTQGDQNVAIGAFAGRSGSKSRGVFIGYEAGFSENNDDRLYIESSNSANPLIYGEFDNDILRVNGTFQVNNPTTTGYSFPNVDGIASQVLQTDGNGVVTFVNTNTLDTNDWSRNGNTGTNSTTNFIGTIDTQNLSFRTNNIEKLRLTQLGQLEFLNTGSSVFIGEDAGTGDNLTDNFNTYVGYSSGRSPNAISEYNSFFGSYAGETTGGFFNSYFGSYAGNISGGDRNTYLGYRAGFNVPGGLNTIIGNQAGETITGSSESNVFIGANSADNFSQGNFNVSLGSNSMRFGDGDENVVIGSGALQFADQTLNNVIIGSRASENSDGVANSVVIGNLAASSANANSGSVIIGNQAGQSLGDILNMLIIHNEDSPFPLIYGEFDNRILALNGSVAINHDAPQAPLHVKGYGNPNTQNIVAALESIDSSRPVLQFSESSTINLSSGMSLEYNGTGNNTTNKLVFNGIGGNALFEFQNGGDLEVLSGDLTTLTGDVVIGTTAGDREIRMGDNAGNNDRVMLRQAGTNHIFIGDIDNNAGNFTIRTGGANAVTVLSGSRNVGIGLTNPTRQLQLSANSAGKPTSGLWDITSDRRLKKDISPFSDGLETLQRINPVWFTYNGLAGMPIETGVGTIAQDLQEVAPYLIKDWKYTAEDGTTENYLGVNYGPLTFIMVNAIKEQSQEIENLKKQLEEQQRLFDEKLNTLEERLTRLEN